MKIKYLINIKFFSCRVIRGGPGLKNNGGAKKFGTIEKAKFILII
jgi:hypothetical protein